MDTTAIEAIVATAAQLEETVAQMDAQTAAEGDVLDRLAAKARPMVRLLGEPIVTEDASESGRDGCHPDSREVHGQLGVVLIDGYRTQMDSTGQGGRYLGHRLWLTRDGYVETARTGTYSYWQGAWNRWTATERPMTGAEVATEYDADDVITVLAAAAEQARGTHPAAAHATRAAKFRALAALL